MDISIDQEKYKQGLEVRSAVLGADHVRRSTADPSDFARPMQHLVTEYCWGTIWTRPNLSRKIRSLLNIAMMTALNHPTELKLHVRGAINNGCTQEEIQEALLQAAVYCGVPAALESFRVADAVIAETSAEDLTPEPSAPAENSGSTEGH